MNRRSAEKRIERRCANSFPFRTGLKQPKKFFSFEPLHNFSDVLRAVAWAEQQRILGFDDDQIANSDGGDKLLGAPQEIAVGVERREASGGYIFSGFARQQLIHGCPGADIAPAHLRGQNKYAWRR